MTEGREAERERDFDRFLTFIDAVVAIAITLLVLRHPELTDGVDDADPVDGVVNTALLLVALGISVVVPVTSYFPLLLLLVARPVANVWRRLRGRGSAGPRVGE